MRRSSDFRSTVQRLLLSAGLALAIGPLFAGEVKLKNGVTLVGIPKAIETLNNGPKKKDRFPTTIHSVQMVSTPLQRYFVPMQQTAGIVNVNLSKHEVFKLPQQKVSGSSRVIAQVGEFVEKPKPFDQHGHRNVKLLLSTGEKTVMQAVTEITPECLKVIALNYDWETALATSSIPFEVLDPMLRQANGSNDADHRLKIARFYIQAEMYGPAQAELAAIEREYPDLSESIRQARTILTQGLAQELLGELKRRQGAGQHRFVDEKARSFPVDNVAAPILREVRDLTEQYDAAREQAEQVKTRLADLQAQLGDDPLVAEVGTRRAEIVEKLNVSNLGRLDAFLKLADDPQLKADETLALALSGWVVGSDNAITELDQALRFFQARMLVLDYLRTPDEGALERKAIREKLSAIEGLGAPRIAQMFRLLPPVRDPAGALPGKATRIQVGSPNDDPPIAYHVLLPLEYQPDHQYPILVVLHGFNNGPEQELAFWGGTESRIGQAQRHGYIVIAPEYTTKADQRTYDYSPAAHKIVLTALRDARQRFSVDSDRVFLAGHNMGGDAAWDMGLSHPDLFAGVIPITGVSDRYCKFYKENARGLALYVVAGELDRDTLARNSGVLMWMMENNIDLIYTEYQGAGLDSYYSEIHKLFDWMSRHRRQATPRKFVVQTMRATDNHFFWYEFDGIPPGMANVDWNAERGRGANPMKIKVELTPGNTIWITSGAAHHRVWLAPDNGFIDFDKRLSVKIGGKQKFNDFLKPDIEAMLEHVRLNGDRQRLYWAVLDF
ncbi:MAG: hypothetical protein EXS05_18450 [Planctomycetaceae bacterium]|nr:hypothetical protein [Planctomycetaceae bacterium]